LWPGNVRELANSLQKALIFSRGCPIGMDQIFHATAGEGPNRDADNDAPAEAIRQWLRRALVSEGTENVFDTYMELFASLLISEALSLAGGNRSRAAKLLGLSRPTLLSKIEKYRLKVETSVSIESS
jgi:DNA-binding NtrC family response regulator